MQFSASSVNRTKKKLKYYGFDESSGKNKCSLVCYYYSQLVQAIHAMTIKYKLKFGTDDWDEIYLHPIYRTRARKESRPNILLTMPTKLTKLQNLSKEKADDIRSMFTFMPEIDWLKTVSAIDKDPQTNKKKKKKKQPSPAAVEGTPVTSVTGIESVIPVSSISATTRKRNITTGVSFTTNKRKKVWNLVSSRF